MTTLSTLDLYKAIVPTFGFTLTDEDLFLTNTPSGTAMPSTINKKRLCLPTDTRLREGFGEDYIPFHPLSESLARQGTSEVQQRLQQQAKAILSYNLLQLATALLEAAADKEAHKDIPVKSTAFLKRLTKADKDTVVVLSKLIAASTKRNRFVTVYLKASGLYEGRKVNRVATVRFPFLSDLKEDKPVGTPIKVEQRKTILALFDLLLPEWEDHEVYSAGTNTRVAPYFTAFLEAFHKVAEILNVSIKKYAKPLQLNLKPIPLYDLELLELFPKLYSEIPPLNGNIGLSEEAKTETETKVIETTAPAPWEAQTVNTTVKPTAAKSVTDSGTVTMDEFNKLRQPAQQFPTYQAPPPPNYGYSQAPQQQQQNPWLNQQQPMQQQQFNPYMQTIQPQMQQQQFNQQPQMQQQQMGWGNMQNSNGSLGLI